MSLHQVYLNDAGHIFPIFPQLLRLIDQFINLIEFLVVCNLGYIVVLNRSEDEVLLQIVLSNCFVYSFF